MSALNTEAQEGAIVLPLGEDAAFATLMDALAPDEPGEEAAAGGEAPAADAGAAGQPAAPVVPAGTAGATAPVPGAGAAGDPVVPVGGAAPDAGAGTEDGAGSAAGVVDFADVREEFGKISTALEEGTLEMHQQEAVEAVQKEFPKYFEALRQAPRMLVGTQVPAIGKEGTETLRDSQDARDWQEAVKQLLSDEVRDRSTRAMEGSSEMLQVVHQSIELFQNNADLVPGTKQFDKELADQFVKLAKPYELRVEGKLNGYTIPVQPLVEQIRAQLVGTRAAAAAAAAPVAPAAPAKPAAPATAQRPAKPPQAGIPSSAGASSEEESFDALFGTIGLSGFRI